MDELIRALPKAELHVHLEGSLSPELLVELAARHGVSGVPGSVAATREWYAFRDFPHFVEVYRAAVRVLRDEDDFARLAETVIGGLAGQNVRHAEITVSLHEHLVRGLPARTVFAGLEAGRKAAQARHDISVRWIPDFAGDRGVEAGEATLDAVLADGPATVLGFGVGGIEVDRDPFADLFARARAAGLRSFPHAGETHGPDRIRSAVHRLGADRIGHGIRAVDDPDLLRYLADHRLPLDVAPTSNLRTRAVATLAAHPLPRLLEAGVLVTLNSDDPPMFGTDLTGEYHAALAMGLTPEDLIGLARSSVQASFADPARRRAMTSGIDEVAAAWRSAPRSEHAASASAGAGDRAGAGPGGSAGTAGSAERAD